MKKLLLIAPDSVHSYRYADLISGYFDDILIVSTKKSAQSPHKIINVDFSLRNPVNHLKSIWKIRAILKDYKPDIIHIHQANSIAYFSLRAAQPFDIPTIVTAWGSDILVAPKKNFLLKQMIKYNLRKATALTSDSKYMAGEMRKLLPEKDLDILIANFGIDIRNREIKKENIIYSNRLHKKLYRIETLIHAFQKFISKQKEEWKLIIAANGEETENLKHLVNKLSLAHNVEFAGWLDQQGNIDNYCRARIFVSIPESDATSISLLEALAYKCIPVVSDIPANREWVQHGANGILVQDYESDFLSEALTLDGDWVVEMNRILTAENSTQPANRSKFIALYGKLLKKAE